MAKKKKKVPNLRFKGFTDDWEQHKLGDVVNLIGGGPFKSTDSVSKGIPWLKIANVGVNGITWNTESYLPEYFWNDYPQYQLKKGNYVVALTRPILNHRLKISKLDRDALLNQRVAKLTTSENLQYIVHLLERKKVVLQIENNLSGSDPPNLSSKDLYRIKIKIPSESNEQKQIGAFLTKLDSIISLQQRKLEFLKEIKKGLLQKMFADKSKFPILRFEGFHNEWEQRKLKNVYQKIGNAFVGTASPYYVDAGHFYLESNNIKNGQINRNHEVFINNSFYQKQSNKLLHTGDLVMVQSGHVGDTAVITQEYNNSAAHALIMFRNPKDKFLSDYLNFYFQNTSAKNKINVLAIGNTIRHVLASDMSRFSVYFPNKDERKYISNLLLKLQYTITLQQSKISQLTILKKYLLQKLFI